MVRMVLAVITAFLLASSACALEIDAKRYEVSESTTSESSSGPSDDWAPGDGRAPTLEDFGFRSDAFSPFVGPPAPPPQSQDGSEECNDFTNDQSDRLSGDEAVYWPESACG